MEVDLEEVMGATEGEMSSQAETARQRIMEKMQAARLTWAELAKTQKEWQAEFTASVEAWKTKYKTEEQRVKNSSEIVVLLSKSCKVTEDAFHTATHIIGSLMDVNDLMAEVNYHDTASLCAQEKEAKREANSFRLQLQEKTKLAESLHPLVAMLKQERDERIEHANKADSLQLQLQEAIEVNAACRAQVAMLEQQLQERANPDTEAKREADSLRVQLQEKTKLSESLHLRVAKLEQERDEREKMADSLQLQLQKANESRRVQVATLERLMRARENEAKEVEDSLPLQLHEQMMKCSSLQSQVAMLKPS